MKKVNHWINGKNVAGNDYFQTTNPATGEVLADVASGGEAEINQAVAAAKEAFFVPLLVLQNLLSVFKLPNLLQNFLLFLTFCLGCILFVHVMHLFSLETLID